MMGLRASAQRVTWVALSALALAAAPAVGLAGEPGGGSTGIGFGRVGSVPFYGIGFSRLALRALRSGGGRSGGVGYGGSGAGYMPYGTNGYAPTTYSSAYTAPATSGGYLTDQKYQPGDGYVYPLYYNPMTRTYYYYPVAR